MGDDLRTTLQEALSAGRVDNAALDAVISDYARYHLVLAVVGTVLLMGVAVLAWWAARRSRSVARTSPRPWTVERLGLLGLSAGGVLVALMLAVVVAANVSTAVAPTRGFEGAVAGVSDARAGTHRAEVQSAYAAWLASGERSAPAGVEAAVSDRLAWQAPKAVVTTVLLGLAVWWVVRVVRRASRPTTDRAPTARLRTVLALGTSTAVAFVLMLMVMGNTQAALAPVAITMFLG